MLLTGQKAYDLERLAQQSPRLDFTGIDFTTLIREVRRSLFPGLQRDVRHFYVDGRSLACIVRSTGDQAPTVFVHDVLNRPDTPIQVFRHIAIHELLHLVIPGRDIDGKWVSHPPEFWAKEEDLSPDRGLVMPWLWWNFRRVLVLDLKQEAIRVKRNWKRIGPVHLSSWEDLLTTEWRGASAWSEEDQKMIRSLARGWDQLARLGVDPSDLGGAIDKSIQFRWT